MRLRQTLLCFDTSLASWVSFSMSRLRQVVAAVEGCRERYMRMDLDYDQARLILVGNVPFFRCLVLPCTRSDSAQPAAVWQARAKGIALGSSAR